MNNTKHTPGPWLYKAVDQDKQILIGEAFGQEACFCSVFPQPSLGVDIKTANANAKLIAAAPELLESLIRVIDRIEENDFQKAFPSAYARAKAAIKKAIE